MMTVCNFIERKGYCGNIANQISKIMYGKIKQNVDSFVKATENLHGGGLNALQNILLVTYGKKTIDNLDDYEQLTPIMNG